METITASKKNKITYFGKGSEFAIIYFKNIFLAIITLGLYYPWAKVERLKYHYQSTEFDGSRFSFTGTGKEIFKGFIKVYLFLIGFYILLTIIVIGTKDQGIITAMSFLFYVFLILLLPFAIHGAIRYRASRSSWKGIHFKYVGDHMVLFKKYILGLFLTFITLGLYSAWFTVDLRKYILKHLKFGNLKFDFKGKGDDLFIIHLKNFIFSFFTLGIYFFWYQKNLWKFYVENIEITQNDKKVNFDFKMKTEDVFELTFINLLLIVFTFGIATPWVVVRTVKFMCRFIELEDGIIDTNSIEQSSIDDYDDASGDDFLDFLDFDFI